MFDTEFNCYVCLECGKRFDKPYECKVVDAGTGKTKQILSQYCPSCGSEDIEQTYDEDYADILREMWAEMV